ncbi:MAG: 50S ribosomal protein L25 [Candidatus Dasytiphilus stammeri]
MITIHAVKYTNHSKSANRKLRLDNQLPAVVYGGNKDPISIILDQNILMKLKNQKEFIYQSLILIIDGNDHQVKVQEIQFHPFKPIILHIDFMRI